MDHFRPRWRKSSYSGPEEECVEVALGHDAALIRDSKNPDGNQLSLPPTSWRAFAAMVKQQP